MVTELVEELGLTIRALEATVPASPVSPKNQQMVDQLEGVMQKYFKALGLALPLDRLKRLYNSQVVKETAK